MILKLDKDYILSIVLIIILKSLIDFGYVNFVCKYYEYDGFLYKFDLFTFILGWLLSILIYHLILIKKNLYIYDIYIFIYILYVLPNIIFYTYTSHNLYYLFVLLVPFVLIILFTLNNLFFNLKKLKFGKIIILVVSSVIILAVIIHFINTTGGEFIFNFNDVYSIREKYSENSNLKIFGYLNSWTFKIFSLLILAWALSKNNFFLISTSILIIILLYMLSGHKSALVGIIVVPFFYFLYKFKNSTNLILILFICITLFSMFLGILFNSLYPESIIIRRMFMVPAFLNFTYLDFFSNNDLIYWSNSILSNFFEYKYDKQLPFIIGEYLGYPKMGANTGFIASGYAHANIFGVFVYSVIAIIIMNLINILSKNYSKFFVMSILIMPLMSMYTSSDLLTSLLTHGLLIGILVLILYENKNYIIRLGKFEYEI